MDQEQIQKAEQTVSRIEADAAAATEHLKKAHQIIEALEDDTPNVFPLRITAELSPKGVGNVADVVGQYGRPGTPARVELEKALGLRDANGNRYDSENFEPN